MNGRPSDGHLDGRLLQRPRRQRLGARLARVLGQGRPGTPGLPGAQVRAGSGALRRVTGEQLAQLMFPSFDDATAPPPLTTGVPASPGAAVGAIVFDSAAAAAATGPVILVRRETNPDDLPGMIAAQGILTSRGGNTSHGAVVARGMGKTCVCGAEELRLDGDTLIVGGRTLHAGDVIAIDGTNARVY